MPGGLLNLVAYGNQNIILNGNPKKTFFKPVYSRYTNFGMQKFRLDFDGQKALRLSEESKYTFKVKRYAELIKRSHLQILAFSFRGGKRSNLAKYVLRDYVVCL